MSLRSWTASRRSQLRARRVRDRLRDVEQPSNSGQPTRLSWLRRFALRPYPYLIFYEATAAEIIIHSVWQAARNPSDRPTDDCLQQAGARRVRPARRDGGTRERQHATSLARLMKGSPYLVTKDRRLYSLSFII